MAVSKTYPAATIAEAAGLGLKLFGENRVQEFASKSSELGPWRKSTEYHLIGHLQSNKSVRAVELFDAVDSVDSLRLAERLNEAAGKLGKRLPILLEVKLSPEEAKAGLDPEAAETAQLLERLPDFAHLETQGLMTYCTLGRRRRRHPRLLPLLFAQRAIAGLPRIRASICPSSPWE